METILPHMMSLPDGAILCLDATLLDELEDDANLDVLLLANSNDDVHDVDHDPNNHDEMANGATLVAFHPRPQIAGDLGRNVTRNFNPHRNRNQFPSENEILSW